MQPKQKSFLAVCFQDTVLTVQTIDLFDITTNSIKHINSWNGKIRSGDIFIQNMKQLLRVPPIVGNFSIQYVGFKVI